MQFSSLMGERVLLLLWGKLLHCGTKERREENPALWSQQNSEQPRRRGLERHNTSFTGMFFTFFALFRAKGNAVLQHWHSSLVSCVSGLRGERILIRDFLSRLIPRRLLGVCASVSHRFPPGSSLPPSFGGHWPCARVPLGERRPISAGLCCTRVLRDATETSLVLLEQCRSREPPGDAVPWPCPRRGCPVGSSESSRLFEVRDALRAACAQYVQLTAALHYKVDWFLNSLKDIRGTILLIVIATT